MIRNFNTNTSNSPWSNKTKTAVWNRCDIVPRKNAHEYRYDYCGAVIKWSEYGRTVKRGFGWEIDHIIPVDSGGGDNLDNLQALQWQHNRKKGNSSTVDYCFMNPPNNF